MLRIFLTPGLVVLSLGFSARAESISSLRGSGMDVAGNPLPDGASDPNYTLIQVPSGTNWGPQTYVVDSFKRPLSTGDWIANGPHSKWIAPAADQSTFPDSGGTGTYIYRTTFDLTGFDSSTARIAGRWATDNPGVDILINNLSTGIFHYDTSTGGFHASFQYFGNILINRGFLPGINTLDFVIYNAPLGHRGGTINPTGLQVELFGEARLVPEPASVVLMAIGGVMAFARRSFGGPCQKRKRRSVSRDQRGTSWPLTIDLLHFLTPRLWFFNGWSGRRPPSTLRDAGKEGGRPGRPCRWNEFIRSSSMMPHHTPGARSMRISGTSTPRASSSRNRWNLLITAVSVVGCLCACTNASGGQINIWDINRGLTVASHSDLATYSDNPAAYGQPFLFDIRDLFGGSFTTNPGHPEEIGNVIFRDGRPAGTVSFVEWTIPIPLAVERLELRAGGDGPDYGNRRDYSEFRLFARDSTTDSLILLFDHFVALHPEPRVVLGALPLVVASSFRAEFVQFGAYGGPRISELSGYVTVVPEPSSLALALLGISTSLLLVRRNWIAERENEQIQQRHERVLAC